MTAETPLSPLVRVSLDPDERLLTLTLDRPKANVLTGAMMAELRQALAAHRESARLRLVALRGAGEHFSFGASVAEHTPQEAPAMLDGFHALIRELVHYPVPVVAVVDGKCLGGAFEVALACHFVLVTERAVFACPEIKLGAFPPVLAALGPLRLGGALTERLLLTGQELSADRAVACGFAERVTGDVDGAAAHLHDTRLAGLSAFALRQATRAARRAGGAEQAVGDVLDALHRQYVDELITSHDGAEGVRAFLEKRAPRWEDR